VAYTISIHPPLVIANLLPDRGRFELMHAVRRTVLWFGDLEPGQQVSVHSVGLDAPLFLLLNLGFAKTPVGEGALIHHGSDPPPGARGKSATFLQEVPDTIAFQLISLFLSRESDQSEVDQEGRESCNETNWKDVNLYG
jgi:hypothetical protein